MLTLWLMAIRPKTLPASVSPILLGSALAIHDGYFDGRLFILAVICALLLQIAVNLANDLFDAESGVDTHERLGPKRVTQSGLIPHSQIRWALILVSMLALLTGLTLVWFSSWWLLAFGLCSLLMVYAYSGGPWPLASHAMGEVAVFFFFGWLAVGGTYFAFTLSLTPQALAYGTIAGLMSAAIMLVNNIRDIHTDTQAKKNTLAVRLGDGRARQLYSVLLSSGLIVHFWVTLPLGFVGLLPLLVVVPLIRPLVRLMAERQGRELNAQLAQTAQMELVYCLIMSVVLVFA